MSGVLRCVEQAEDIFPEPDVDAMVAFLNGVRANAIATDHVAQERESWGRFRSRHGFR